MEKVVAFEERNTECYRALLKRDEQETQQNRENLALFEARLKQLKQKLQEAS